MGLYEKIEIIICVVALCGLSVEDVKTKKVPLRAIVILGIGLLGIRLLEKEEIVKVLLGMLPGVAAILVSVATRGGFGMGDALLLTTLGISCGPERTLEIWFLALLMGALFGGLLLILKKVSRKTALPFVPFIFAGYGISEVLYVLA